MPAKSKTPDQIAELVKSLPGDPGLRAYEVFVKIPLPLPMGAIKLVAEQLGIPRFRADQAAALRAAFEINPEARAQWEGMVLSGALSIHRALVRVRPSPDGRTATLKPARGVIAHLTKPWSEIHAAIREAVAHAPKTLSSPAPKKRKPR